MSSPCEQAKDFWNRNTESHKIESSQGGDARRLWNEGSSYITRRLRDNKLDKPGGDVKKVTDATRHAHERLSKTVFGKWGDDDESSSSTGDIAEADTRSTIARAGRKDTGNAAFNRRGVAETMVNINKGKKHTLLTQKKGGR